MAETSLLTSRLENWKFLQAKNYLDHAPVRLRPLIEALADFWGDTGWARGGSFEPILGYVVDNLVRELSSSESDAA